MRKLIIAFCLTLAYVAVLGAETGNKHDDHIYRSGVDDVLPLKAILTPHVEPPKLPASKSGKIPCSRKRVPVNCTVALEITFHPH